MNKKFLNYPKNIKIKKSDNFVKSRKVPDLLILDASADFGIFGHVEISRPVRGLTPADGSGLPGCRPDLGQADVTMARGLYGACPI